MIFFFPKAPLDRAGLVLTSDEAARRRTLQARRERRASAQADRLIARLRRDRSGRSSTTPSPRSERPA